jgi:hypothetical protein
MILLEPSIGFVEEIPAFTLMTKRQAPHPKIETDLKGVRFFACGVVLSGFPGGVLTQGFGAQVAVSCDLGFGKCLGDPGEEPFRPGPDIGRLIYLGWEPVDPEDWTTRFEGEDFLLYAATDPEHIWSPGNGSAEVRCAGVNRFEQDPNTGEWSQVPVEIGLGKAMIVLLFAIETDAKGPVNFHVLDMEELGDGWLDSDGAAGGTATVTL